MRFRKSIQICKGLKINLSKSGVSATVGGRGLSFNLGSKGVFMNTSLPGTGLYDRKKLFGPEKKARKPAATREQEIALPSFSLKLEEDGNVAVYNAETGQEIRGDRVLRKIRATEEYQQEYAQLMAAYKEAIEDENQQFSQIIRFAEPLRSDWEEDPKYLSPAYVEGSLDGWLENLQLPVEFALQYEYHHEPQCVMVDLDLPEIEDIPDTKAVELADGSVKERSKSLRDLRMDYIHCVFGMAVYFASNIFNVSPYIEQVCVSGYSQRRSRSGDLQDEYLYSIRFKREGFEGVDFAAVEPLEFCMNFQNRCNISSSGEMKTIEPYEE